MKLSDKLYKLNRSISEMIDNDSFGKGELFNINSQLAEYVIEVRQLEDRLSGEEDA